MRVPDAPASRGQTWRLAPVRARRRCVRLRRGCWPRRAGAARCFQNRSRARFSAVCLIGWRGLWAAHRAIRSVNPVPKSVRRFAPTTRLWSRWHAKWLRTRAAGDRAKPICLRWDRPLGYRVWISTKSSTAPATPVWFCNPRAMLRPNAPKVAQGAR